MEDISWLGDRAERVITASLAIGMSLKMNLLVASQVRTPRRIEGLQWLCTLSLLLEYFAIQEAILAVWIRKAMQCLHL
jgi:hypothetical protein